MELCYYLLVGMAASYGCLVLSLTKYWKWLLPSYLFSDIITYICTVVSNFYYIGACTVC